MLVTTHGILTEALTLGPRELVAMVGGGGKTGCLKLLAGELSGRSARVVTTTTTAMFLKDLEDLGPVLVESGLPALRARLEVALTAGVPVGAVRSVGPDGKAIGLPVEWVDDVWRAGFADHVVVEADGSRGMSLKAFGAHEPQVPVEVTFIVQVAGLDVMGAPLEEPYVHRAELLASALGVQPGTIVTGDLFANALRRQLRLLRRRWPRARVMTLLNKAEEPHARSGGLEVAEMILATVKGKDAASPVPEAVVVGSLWERSFTRVSDRGGRVSEMAGKKDSQRKAARVSAIVLAAGQATRMGGQKLLLPLGERSLVERVADAALGAKVFETIVVVGHEAEAVRAALGDRPVRIVLNPGYAAGLSTSLQAGIRAVRPDCEAVVFLLGDQPFATSALVDRLIEVFADAQAWIVRPSVGGRPGHPVLMGRDLFAEILEQQGDVGGREISERHRDRQILVPLDDERLAVDVDTEEDYEAASSAI